MKYFKLGSRFKINDREYLLSQVNEDTYLIDLTTGVRYGEQLLRENVSELHIRLSARGEDYTLVG